MVSSSVSTPHCCRVLAAVIGAERDELNKYTRASLLRLPSCMTTNQPAYAHLLTNQSSPSPLSPLWLPPSLFRQSFRDSSGQVQTTVQYPVHGHNTHSGTTTSPHLQPTEHPEYMYRYVVVRYSRWLVHLSLMSWVQSQATNKPTSRPYVWMFWTACVCAKFTFTPAPKHQPTTIECGGGGIFVLSPLDLNEWVSEWVAFSVRSSFKHTHYSYCTRAIDRQIVLFPSRGGRIDIESELNDNNNLMVSPGVWWPCWLSCYSGVGWPIGGLVVRWMELSWFANVFYYYYFMLLWVVKEMSLNGGQHAWIAAAIVSLGGSIWGIAHWKIKGDYVWWNRGVLGGESGDSINKCVVYRSNRVEQWFI